MCVFVLQDTENSEAIKNMRQSLDANQDGKVSFQEYMTLVGYLAQSLSQQRCTKETQAEATEASKDEPEAEKEANPVKEEEPAKEQDEAMEVVKLVEEEDAGEVIEVEECT